MIHEIGHCLNFTKINLMTGWGGVGGGDFCFPLAGNVVFLSLISIVLRKYTMILVEKL